MRYTMFMEWKIQYCRHIPYSPIDLKVLMQCNHNQNANWLFVFVSLLFFWIIVVCVCVCCTWCDKLIQNCKRQRIVKALLRKEGMCRNPYPSNSTTLLIQTGWRYCKGRQVDKWDRSASSGTDSGHADILFIIRVARQSSREITHFLIHHTGKFVY